MDGGGYGTLPRLCRRFDILRFAKILAFGVLVVTPDAAHARGGPGGAIGSALVTLIYAALVPGALLGVAIGRSAWSVRGQVVVALVLVSCVLLWSFGSWSRLLFFSVPVMASMTVTLAVSQLLVPASDRLRGAGQWLAITYLFWVAVSLLNTEFLGVFVVPVVAFSAYAIFGKFLPFIVPPLALGITVATMATLILRRTRTNTDQRLPALAFNASLLIVLALSAELYKNFLIDRALDGHNPTCASTHSFISSVQNAGRLWRGPSHAYFEENGKRYHWSYSERRFVEASGHKLVCEPAAS